MSQGCFHSLNNYSGLIILSTSGGYLKLINYIISDRRIPLLAGIPLCKSQELSQREHSTSRLCSIHHDIPVTMHTPAAYGQWSVFDHSGDNQSAVLGTRYGIWWPWYPNFCEKLFFSLFPWGPIKLIENALLRAYICKSFLGRTPRISTCAMESPPAPSTHAVLRHIVPYCPTKKFQ